MENIGFIGLGTIGGPMALRIAEAGHGLTVFDISDAACAKLADAGAQVAASATQLARDCETIFLSLPGPPQIESVVLGDDGLLAHAGALKTIVDLSTNAVELNRRVAATAAEAGIAYLDAPVSGGKHAAAGGTLAVMVGGEEAAFERVRPLIACFGEHLFYMGDSGAGTLTKLVNNQIILCASVLVQEGFVLGAKAGMDPSALLKVLKVSSAGSVLGGAGMFLSKKFDGGLFALDIAAKDVRVALDSANSLASPMPLTTAAHEVYQEAIAAGLGSEDFFATVKILEQQAGCALPALKKRPDKS